MSDDEGRDFVQSLDRGLAVLRAFDRDHPSLTLSDVARLTDLTRATARRLLLTLVSLGYASTDGKYFELTPMVLDLGHAYVSSLQLPDLAQPHMEALSEQVHESVSASVLDGHEIVYVARVPTQRIMAISLAIGSRLPPATSSTMPNTSGETNPAPKPSVECAASTRPRRRSSAAATTPAVSVEIGRAHV